MPKMQMQIQNAENLRKNKSGLFLIVEQILVFALSSSLVREVKNLPTNLKRIACDILHYSFG